MTTETADDSGFGRERTALSDTSDFESAESPNLVVLTGPRAGLHIALDRRLLIGRDQECNVRLDAEDVSRHHAEISPTADGAFTLRDLGSQNGTWIDGLPIDTHVLRPGERVRIGGKTVVMLSLFGDIEGELRHQQRLESLGVLAGGIAHDFNNLMAVILGNAEYLEVLPRELDLGSEHVRGTVDDLRAAAHHAADLARQLLALARRSPVDEQRLNVGRLVEDVVQVMRRKFNRAISVKVEADQEGFVSGDPAQLRQVLMNLCVNANDAMPDGGDLSLRCWRELEQGDPKVCVEVQDSGMGIRSDRLERVFEPFYSGKALGLGSGMGLAIAKRIVTDHGGSIEVESVVGEGTAFRFRLPFRPDAEHDHSPTIPVLKLPSLEASKETKLLVVDDDPLHARTLNRTLAYLGYEPLMARNLEECSVALSGDTAPVKLALVNTALGGAGVQRVCEWLRANHAGVKLVVISGAADEYLHALRNQVTPDAVLLKPFDRASLFATLIELVNESLSG